MQKLVVSWQTGDEYSGTDHILCIRYESPEAFYCELEKASAKFAAMMTAYINEDSEIEEKIRKISKRDKDYESKCAEIRSQKKFPSWRWGEHGIVTIAGIQWELGDFVKWGTSVFEPPTIQTLEEWFESQEKVWL